MRTGWRYRGVSVAGVVILAVLAVVVANHPVLQSLFTKYVPLFWRLDPVVLSGNKLRLVVAVTVLMVVGSLFPLYKPRPRRVLDIVALAQKRVVVAGLALATLGYFKWSHRVPRATLTMSIGLLLVVVPLWFLQIRRAPTADPDRTLIVGDDLAQMQRIVDDSDRSFLGYLCPSSIIFDETKDERARALSDGGEPITGFERLGGLSRIEDVLVEYDVETVVLAFHRADREEFFGTLDACYEHGVGAEVHRDYADSVLTTDDVGTFRDVDIEPWDVQDHMIKRAFDIAFAGTALLVLSPAVLAIVLAIKLEGEGPVFFSQERTYLLGNTFTVYKFRTLKPEPGGEVGTTFDGSRETPLGNFLRATHLDEIPQLWSILVGDMSVVGPRPAQTAIEEDFQAEAAEWSQRWFVKPGLTGLAQINDATSEEPREKIQYDLQYIRNQSFWFDLKIVVRQFWKVFVDIAELRKKT